MGKDEADVLRLHAHGIISAACWGKITSATVYALQEFLPLQSNEIIAYRFISHAEFMRHGSSVQAAALLEQGEQKRPSLVRHVLVNDILQLVKDVLRSFIKLPGGMSGQALAGVCRELAQTQRYGFRTLQYDRLIAGAALMDEHDSA